MSSYDDARALNRATSSSITTIGEIADRLGDDHQVALRFNDGSPARPQITPGELFVASKSYKQIANPDERPQTWSTGPIELQTKGTIVSTPGTALTPPGYVPGVVETLFQPLTIADLFGQAQTASSQLRYAVEETITNAAAPVDEAGEKPESTITFSETTEPVRKLATVIHVSDEMLEDASAIQSYINERLSLLVRITEEEQLLDGDGNAPNLAGLLGRLGVQTHNRGTVTNIDAIRSMITKARDSFLEPDAIVLNPAQWENIQLLKDTTDNYLGNPFTGGPDTLWGKRVVLTNAVSAGTALVGAFKQGATVHRRGRLTVEATNSHDQHFVHNLVAIRAETRLALAVYRPAAFVKGTAFA